MIGSFKDKGRFWPVMAGLMICFGLFAGDLSPVRAMDAPGNMAQSSGGLQAPGSMQASGSLANSSGPMMKSSVPSKQSPNEAYNKLIDTVGLLQAIRRQQGDNMAALAPRLAELESTLKELCAARPVEETKLAPTKGKAKTAMQPIATGQEIAGGKAKKSDVGSAKGPVMPSQKGPTPEELEASRRATEKFHSPALPGVKKKLAVLGAQKMQAHCVRLSHDVRGLKQLTGGPGDMTRVDAFLKLFSDQLSLMGAR